jgi:hypothetical protein
MRALFFFLLLTPILASQEPLPVRELALDLRTELGIDPGMGILLTPRGCWDGLILAAPVRPLQTSRKAPAGATVEVWDFPFQESNRNLTFGLYLGALRQRLSKALELPPPKHQAIELSEIMATDPSSPQKLDITKVKSMQDRFNRPPPTRSPVQ